VGPASKEGWIGGIQVGNGTASFIAYYGLDVMNGSTLCVTRDGSGGYSLPAYYGSLI